MNWIRQISTLILSYHRQIVGGDVEKRIDPYKTYEHNYDMYSFKDGLKGYQRMSNRRFRQGVVRTLWEIKLDLGIRCRKILFPYVFDRLRFGEIFNLNDVISYLDKRWCEHHYKESFVDDVLYCVPNIPKELFAKIKGNSLLRKLFLEPMEFIGDEEVNYVNFVNPSRKNKVQKKKEFNEYINKEFDGMFEELDDLISSPYLSPVLFLNPEYDLERRRIVLSGDVHSNPGPYDDGEIVVIFELVRLSRDVFSSVNSLRLLDLPDGILFPIQSSTSNSLVLILNVLGHRRYKMFNSLISANNIRSTINFSVERGMSFNLDIPLNKVPIDLAILTDNQYLVIKKIGFELIRTSVRYENVQYRVYIQGNSQTIFDTEYGFKINVPVHPFNKYSKFGVINQNLERLKIGIPILQFQCVISVLFNFEFEIKELFSSTISQ